jgi:hypothetical protein
LRLRARPRPLVPARARQRLPAFACACLLASAIGFATVWRSAVKRLIMSLMLLMSGVRAQNRSKMHGFVAILGVLAKVNK